MHLLRYILVGAAVGYGINYITKKGPDGRAILDDIAEKAPDWFDDAKTFVDETIGNLTKAVKEKVDF